MPILTTPEAFTPEQFTVTGDALRAIVDTLVVAFGTRTFDPAFRSNPPPVNVSRYLAHDFPAVVRRAEEAIADALPALTEADVVKLANGDRGVRAEIEAWRDRFDFADVTELRGATEEDIGEAWEIVAGGSSRYEAREVPRYEARMSRHGLYFVHDNETNDEADDNEDAVTQAGLDPAAASFTEREVRELVAVLNEREEVGSGDMQRWIVWDTEQDEDARGVTHGPLVDCEQGDYDTEDESSARGAAEAGNMEDYRANCHAMPFAWNTAAKIDRMYTEDFAAAGFVVAEHTPSGDLYAGIDGGGYDFIEAHWSRAFLRAHLHGKYSPERIYMRTDAGLRRAVREGDK